MEASSKGGADGTKKNLPLLRAVKDGKTSAITSLLESGEVDVNFQNHCKAPAKASQPTKTSAQSASVSHCARVRVCSRVRSVADGDTALILAAWYGHVDITRLLLDAHADVNATNCDGNCALNCAAYHGFMEVASLLVDANATIDVRDNVTGKTALIKAAYVGHADVAEVLLRAGADRNAMDNQGYSALAFSTSFNHIGVLDVLLRAKADPNVQDEVCELHARPGCAASCLPSLAARLTPTRLLSPQFGITPLIHSAARGYADAVEMLLKAGAKPGLMDMEGKNALDYAESAEFDDVVAMLAACDEGPSVCSTSRDGATTEPMSQRGLGATSGGAGGASARSPQSARGGTTARMTPRVPMAGEVSSRLTPRAPHHGGAVSNRGSSSRVTPSAYRGGNSRAYEVSPSQMGGLERDKMLYLAKKLVHLSILLEQDTVQDDFKYPSFHSPQPAGYGYS